MNIFFDYCKYSNDLCVISYTCLGVSYCGIALRYVDDFQLYTFILGCVPYDAISHSAVHLREFVNRVLNEYKLQLETTKLVVTDNEPKMLSAFRDQCSRVRCSDHYLSKQLQHAFESEQIHLNRNTVEKVDCDLAQNTFNQVKKIVSSVRRSHQQRKLSRQLQMYSQTRFGGAIIMLNIFRDVFFELPEVLSNTKVVDDYNMIDKELLDEICDFLEAFDEVIVALNEDKQPSLHRVLPFRQHLLNKCEVKEGDSMAITQLKVFLGEKRIPLNISLIDLRKRVMSYRSDIISSS